MKKNIVTLLLLFISFIGYSQCPVSNNAFQAGEKLSYDLYFKYGLIHKKAGVSHLSVNDDIFRGKNTYKIVMEASSIGMAKKIIEINDTVYSCMSKELVPLAFFKNAYEGDDHTQEWAIYDYQPDKINIQAKRIRNEVLRFDETLTTNHCIYDMLSIIYYLRTLDFSSMQKGDITQVSYVSGKKLTGMSIEHKGTERIEANDKQKYQCIKLVLSLNEKGFEDKKEAMTVYVSSDENRIPIRIDSKLKVGSTRIVLSGYKGLKHTAATN